MSVTNEQLLKLNNLQDALISEQQETIGEVSERNDWQAKQLAEAAKRNIKLATERDDAAKYAVGLAERIDKLTAELDETKRNLDTKYTQTIQIGCGCAVTATSASNGITLVHDKKKCVERYSTHNPTSWTDYSFLFSTLVPKHSVFIVGHGG